MGTKVFWQFIFRAIMTAIAAIHSHMTSKMGVATIGQMYLLIHKFERYWSRYNGDMKLSCCDTHTLS